MTPCSYPTQHHYVKRDYCVREGKGGGGRKAERETETETERTQALNCELLIKGY